MNRPLASPVVGRLWPSDVDDDGDEGDEDEEEDEEACDHCG